MSFEYSRKSALRLFLFVLAVFLCISVVATPAAAAGEQTFTEKFYQNFIEDDRWRYLFTGLQNTLIITFFALILGVAIGVVVAIVRSSHDKITAMDDRFHQSLYSLSGSRMFQKTLADLHTYVEPVRERSIREPGRAAAMLAEHRAIVDAIAAHDQELAAKLMTQHITRAGEHMEKNHLL